MTFTGFIDCKGFSALRRNAFCTGFFMRAICLQPLKEILETVIVLYFFALNAAFIIWVLAGFLLHLFFLFGIIHALEALHVRRVHTLG